jgi:predicted amidohydrolase
MRKVKLGAIQPAVLPVKPRYDCLADLYRADVKEIVKHNLMPQAEVNFALLEEAGQAGLDIVTTSEDICAVSHYIIDTSERNVFPELVRESAAFIEERTAELARRYSMYIAACYMKAEDGFIYNTASIFNRAGAVVGSYRKTHLPPNETWQVTAGNELPVFDLDFGRVGIEICYDMMFSEVGEALSRKGAEVVLHPTAGYGWYDSIGEATLRTRANDGGFYIVTAKNYCYNGAGHSSVIDYWGQILADAGFYQNKIVWAEVDLDVPKTQPDWHYQTGMTGQPDVRWRKECERRPDLYTPLYAPYADPQVPPGYEARQEIFEKVKAGVFHW